MKKILELFFVNRISDGFDKKFELLKLDFCSGYNANVTWESDRIIMVSYNVLSY